MEAHGADVRKDIEKAGEVRDKLNAHAEDITRKVVENMQLCPATVNRFNHDFD